MIKKTSVPEAGEERGFAERLSAITNRGRTESSLEPEVVWQVPTKQEIRRRFWTPEEVRAWATTNERCLALCPLGWKADISTAPRFNPEGYVHNAPRGLWYRAAIALLSRNGMDKSGNGTFPR